MLSCFVVSCYRLILKRMWTLLAGQVRTSRDSLTNKKKSCTTSLWSEKPKNIRVYLFTAHIYKCKQKKWCHCTNTFILFSYKSLLVKFSNWEAAKGVIVYQKANSFGKKISLNTQIFPCPGTQANVKQSFFC